MSEHDPNVAAAFVEGRLSPDEREAFLGHLAECRDCREVLARLTAAAPAPRRRVSAWLPLAASVAVLAGAFGAYQLTTGPRAVTTSPATAAPNQPVEPAREPPRGPSPSAPPQTPASPPPSTNPAPAAADPLRAARTRQVGGRSFRLEAGEWVDTGYSVADLLPVVDVLTVDAWRAHPDLATFEALLPRFTVVVGGTVYRVNVPRAPR